MFKKFMVALLAAAMAASLISCASQQQAPGEQSSPASSSAAPASSEASQKAEGTSTEADHLKIFMGGSGRTANEVTELQHDALLEATGVDCEWIMALENWQQKYALLISSGDIPDISYLPISFYYQYAQEGAFYDISNEIANYPNIQNWGDSQANVWDRMKVNGVIYGVPVLTLEGRGNMSYRKDWLDKLGLTVPTTLDGFTEVMKAFAEQDPDENGMRDTYGFSACPTSNNLEKFMVIYGAYGVAPGYYHKNDEGKVVIDSLSEEYKQALQYIKELYDLGYIDQEIFTQKEEQFWQKYVQKKIGCYTGWWHTYHYPYTNNVKALESDPDLETVVGVPLTGPEGKSGFQGQDPLSNAAAISFKVEDPAPALRLMDYMLTVEGYRTVAYGVKDLHYTLDSAGNLDWYAGIDPEPKDTTGHALANFDSEVGCMFYLNDIYPERFIGDEIKPVKQREGYANSMNAAQIRNLFVGLISDAYVNKMPDVTKYVDEMRVKFIMGDASFDDWDAYVSEYKRMGGLEVAESLLEEYNKTYGESLELMAY